MRTLPRFVLLLTICLASATLLTPGQAAQMPIDEIRPGMVGRGVTVFNGTAREEFSATILGVLENVMGPRRSLILARLEGGPLAETGVIAGMSGSPVYIDDRLVGAVSYSLGSFSKEPIAGITPIGEMTEVTTLPPRPTARRLATVPATPQELHRALSDGLGGDRVWSDADGGVRARGLSATEGSRVADLLRPIATPLVMSGYGAEARQLIADLLGEHGFVPMIGGGAAAAMAADPEPLQPGDPIGVSLVRGDLELGSTGTVTHVDGDLVYAFGHPFLNLGPTTFPMTRAYIYAVLPSLMSSTKLSGLGETIGTVSQDRATAVAGTLGGAPDLVPLTMTLDSDRGLSKQFEFSLVTDQMLTPVLAYVSILNTLQSYARQAGGATFEVRGTARVKGHGEIAFEDLFTGDSPSIGAAAYIAAPITFLLANDLAPIELDGIEIAVTSSEEPRSASIERVWLDAVDVRAGRTVPLKILTRSYRGDETIRTVPIAIPANAAGRLSILVSDGVQLTQLERRERSATNDPASIAQMIRTLNSQRKNNRLYVRLLRPDAGAVVNGEPLSALPPSILAVFDGDRSGGDVISLDRAAVGDWELQTDHAVTGSRLLTINVESK